jgi:hypothetical protein
VILLDVKRAQNIGIALAQFRNLDDTKMTHAQIRQAVLEMDGRLMTEDRLESLQVGLKNPDY